MTPWIAARRAEQAVEEAAEREVRMAAFEARMAARDAEEAIKYADKTLADFLTSEHCTVERYMAKAVLDCMRQRGLKIWTERQFVAGIEDDPPEGWRRLTPEEVKAKVESTRTIWAKYARWRNRLITMENWPVIGALILQ
jgi:hypothetical protein